MPGQGEITEAVLLAGAAADVVDDEGETGGVLFRGDDHDVREVGRDGAGEYVPREVALFRKGDSGVFPFEKGNQVRDAAVVDVFVRAGEAPVLRVFRKIRLHVLMNEFLEILSEGIPQCTDDDIGADAALHRHIAAGVIEGSVGGIVADGDADLFPRGGYDLFAGCGGADSKSKQPEDYHGTHPGSFGAKVASHKKKERWRHQFGFAVIMNHQMIPPFHGMKFTKAASAAILLLVAPAGAEPRLTQVTPHPRLPDRAPVIADLFGSGRPDIFLTLLRHREKSETTPSFSGISATGLSTSRVLDPVLLLLPKHFYFPLLPRQIVALTSLALTSGTYFPDK